MTFPDKLTIGDIHEAYQTYRDWWCKTENEVPDFCHFKAGWEAAIKQQNRIRNQAMNDTTWNELNVHIKELVDYKKTQAAIKFLCEKIDMLNQVNANKHRRVTKADLEALREKCVNTVPNGDIIKWLQDD